MVMLTELRREWALAREQSDRLFTILDPEAFYERPIRERHRIIFYLGHLETFDRNLLIKRNLDGGSIHSSFDRLFERGIDPEPGQLPSDKPADWPSVAEVREYVARTRDRIDESWNELSQESVEMALEHRLMHAETLTYMLHNLPFEKKMCGGPEAAPEPVMPRQEMITVPAGRATLGRTREDGFGWDNEFDSTGIDVPAFRIGKYKVTNGEYLTFVREGGSVPHFWSRRGTDWFYRGMFHESPLRWDAPAWVTHQQAQAYAGWRGMALPSETQFHRAAYGTPEGLERQWPWSRNGNGKLAHPAYDFRSWDPVSVTATPHDASAWGVTQMIGNGWEWTSTLFEPFDGFRAHPDYPGYSADFFDQRHFVLKGASPVTAARLTRRSFRNWFRPEYPYIYAGFRLVDNQA